MYTFDGRVRYSETDENGRLTPLAMINYLQDCSTFQSEDLGIGVAWLKEHHRAWFLNSWRILIDRAPALGERIRIGTFAYGFKGIYGYRHFFIQDSADAFCVRADSIWFLCDTDSMTPVKAEREFTEPYMRTDSLDLRMGETKRKIALPSDMQPLSEVPVMRHHLDTNHHVNNAQYVEIALSAGGGLAPAEIQAEYKRAAVLGDVLHLFIGEEKAGGQRPAVKAEAGGAQNALSGGLQAAAGTSNGGARQAAKIVALCDAEERPYAIVRFREAENGGKIK